MKNILTAVLGCLLVAAGFAQFNFKSDFASLNKHTENALKDIPLVKAEKRPDIFFKEEKPNQEFYKVKLIETAGNESVSYNQLLADLQKKAMDNGLDGLMILDMKQWQTISRDYSIGGAVIRGAISGLLKTDVNEYEYRNPPLDISNVKALYAIGLKYKANMQYVDTIVKLVQIEQFDDAGNTQGIQQVPLDLNGYLQDSVLTPADILYVNHISPFNRADFFSKNDAFKTRFDAYRSYKARAENLSGTDKYKAVFEYGNLTEVKLTQPTISEDSTVTYKIKYQQNEQHQIQCRYLFTGKKYKTVYKDVFNYDERNRVTGFERYNASNNTRLLKVRYVFYSLSDLPECDKD